MSHERGSTIEEIEHDVLSLVHDRNASLEAIAREAHPLWVETSARGEVAGSNLLDSVCLAIGREARAAIAEPAFEPSTKASRTFAYVFSRLYKNGGHTRVLEDIIRSRPAAEHVILCTDEPQPDDPAEDRARIRVEQPFTVYRLRGAQHERLVAGFRELDRIAPDVLVHLGHPDDPIALALMQPRAGCRRLVIHHADHSFSLGRSVPEATHISLTPNFSEHAARHWNLTTAFLPLTCPEPTVPGAFAATPLVTASSASSHKFDLRGDPSYLDVLRERFARREGDHVHFGELEDAQLATIRDGLRSSNASERFRYVAFVPSLANALIEAGVNVFIDSVPMGGAKTLIEAMCAGVAIAFAAHHPTLGGSQFAYDGAITFRTAAELGTHLAGADADVVSDQARRSRLHYERHHSPLRFARVFEDILRTTPVG